MQVSAVKTMMYFLCPLQTACSMQLPIRFQTNVGCPLMPLTYTQAGYFTFYSTRSTARVRLISMLAAPGVYMLGREVCTICGKA